MRPCLCCCARDQARREFADSLLEDRVVPAQLPVLAHQLGAVRFEMTIADLEVCNLPLEPSPPGRGRHCDGHMTIGRRASVRPLPP